MRRVTLVFAGLGPGVAAGRIQGLQIPEVAQAGSPTAAPGNVGPIPSPARPAPHFCGPQPTSRSTCWGAPLTTSPHHPQGLCQSGTENGAAPPNAHSGPPGVAATFQREARRGSLALRRRFLGCPDGGRRACGPGHPCCSREHSRVPSAPWTLVPSNNPPVPCRGRVGGNRPPTPASLGTPRL